MSVKKLDREESSAQFVATALKLLDSTSGYLALLSNRRFRAYGDKVISLCVAIVDSCSQANALFPCTQENIQIRLCHLRNAYTQTMSLSTFLTICYKCIYENPQGAFVSSTTKKPLPSEKCCNKVDRMSANLGDLLNTELSLIGGQIDKYSKLLQ